MALCHVDGAMVGRGTSRPLVSMISWRTLGVNISVKPNVYCKAIELVCGGSFKICVLVERITPAQSEVGGIAAKTSLDQLFV